MSHVQTIECRAATTDDALSISALATYVFLDTYATDGIRPDLAREVFAGYSVEIFLSQLKSSHSVDIYIAETNNHMLGFAEIDRTAKLPVVGMKSGMEIIKLYVQPGFHGQGVGTALLRMVEQRTRELALQTVWLTVWTGNLKAIRFYEYCGFIDVGCVNNKVEDRVYNNRVFSKCLD